MSMLFSLKKLENENTYSGGYKGGYTAVHRT